MKLDYIIKAREQLFLARVPKQSKDLFYIKVGDRKSFETEHSISFGTIYVIHIPFNYGVKYNKPDCGKMRWTYHYVYVTKDRTRVTKNFGELVQFVAQYFEQIHW